MQSVADSLKISTNYKKRTEIQTTNLKKARVITQPIGGKRVDLDNQSEESACNRSTNRKDARGFI